MAVTGPPRRWGYTKATVGGDVVCSGDGGLTEADDAEVRARAATVRAAKVAKLRRAGTDLLNDLELHLVFRPEGDTDPVATPTRTTPDIVRRVRALRREGLANREISRLTGLSSANVSRIATGWAWAWVDAPESESHARRPTVGQGEAITSRPHGSDVPSSRTPRRANQEAS